MAVMKLTIPNAVERPARNRGKAGALKRALRRSASLRRYETVPSVSREEARHLSETFLKAYQEKSDGEFELA
ncbi:hypothetical protein [Kalamiella sp. sgz302252]|uniref:hypothetical protein n=1 Tax=Pantoea sp. sgz302252 TaxID=3341827 RepID=UPI0036D43D09